MKESLDYYNSVSTKMIADYLNGNPRVEGAIKNLACFIPESSSNILDIGCGIGWSSYEFAKEFRSTKVTGIDLSPVLIETASSNFQRPNLEFYVKDITKSLPENCRYDVITMIDVYEHIPLESRDLFHRRIKSLLGEGGRFMLACPSKFHQNWLRENNPSGLQPVDEDIDLQALQQIAKDINSELVCFSYTRIWRDFDYFYAVFQSNPKYTTEGNLKLADKLIELDSLKKRQQRFPEYSKSIIKKRFKGYYKLKKVLSFLNIK